MKQDKQQKLWTVTMIHPGDPTSENRREVKVRAGDEGTARRRAQKRNPGWSARAVTAS